MAPYYASDADYFKDKARRDLLSLLEAVSKAPSSLTKASSLFKFSKLIANFLGQVRGKKNIVISQDLTGSIGLFVKFSVLQEYGVDRVFLLQNANVDSSQRNVVFLVRAEKISQVRMVAGMLVFLGLPYIQIPISNAHSSPILPMGQQ